MAAGSAEIASEQRTPRRSLGEQRHYGAAGIARRREPGLSFAQRARMGRAYGKCGLSFISDVNWKIGQMTKKTILIALLATVAAAPAWAGVTYTYTGHDFTTASAPYTTSDFVSVTLDFTTALAGGLANSTVHPTSWIFSDGVQTLTNTSVGFFASFSITTDVSGRITAWSMGEQATSFLDIPAINTSSVTGDSAYRDSFSQSATVTGAAGVWTSPDAEPAAIPAPPTASLFGLALAGLVFVRRSRSAR